MGAQHSFWLIDPIEAVMPRKHSAFSDGPRHQGCKLLSLWL